MFGFESDEQALIMIKYLAIKRASFVKRSRNVTFEHDPVKRLRKSNFVNYLHIKPFYDEKGNLALKLTVDEHVLNLNGTLHGGVHAALLDTVIGQTIAQQAECPVATIHLSIYYSAPA